MAVTTQITCDGCGTVAPQERAHEAGLRQVMIPGHPPTLDLCSNCIIELLSWLRERKTASVHPATAPSVSSPAPPPAPSPSPAAVAGPQATHAEAEAH